MKSMSEIPESERSPICLTCGTQYPGESAPDRCPICEDDRQYVGKNGQEWTSLSKMRGHYHNRFIPIEPGIVSLVTEPAFAIGHRAYLVQTEQGNVLWDLLPFVDESTIAEIERLGGISAIAISHPHYYATMGEWSRRLGGAPIHLHAANEEWVMRPDPAVKFFAGDRLELLPGVTVVHCGGHFP